MFIPFDVLFLIALLLFFILCVIFSLLLWRKIVMNAYFKTVQQLKDDWRLRVEAVVLKDASPSLPPIQEEEELEAVIAVLYRYHLKSLQTDERERLEALAETLLVQPLTKELKSYVPARRLEALQQIEYYRIHALLPAVSTLHHMHELTLGEERMRFNIWASLGEISVADRIRQTTIALSNFEWLTILSKLNETSRTELMQNIETYEPEELILLLDAITFYSWNQYADVINYAFTYPLDSEIFLRGIKAATETKFVISHDIVRLALEATSWETRFLMLRYVHSGPYMDFFPFVRDKLRDSVFLVRKEAAVALHDTEEGRAILTEVKETSDDRFAREIAKEWLFEEEEEEPS